MQQGFASKKKKKKSSPPTQLHVANACLICPSNYCAWLDDTDIFRTEMLLIASLIQEAISQHSHSCLATAAATDIPAACSYGTLLMDVSVCSRAKVRPVGICCPSLAGYVPQLIRYLSSHQVSAGLSVTTDPPPQVLVSIPGSWSPSQSPGPHPITLIANPKPCLSPQSPASHPISLVPILKPQSPSQSSTSHLTFLVPILKPWFPPQSPDPHSTLPVPTLDLWSLSLSLRTQG